MKCPAFEPLITDMKVHQIDKERYQFTYHKLIFDVILSIMGHHYEILVAIHQHNWGCVLNMDKYFNVTMQDNDYYSLCKLLNLNWNKYHFSSAVFLRLLSEKAPIVSKRENIYYEDLRPFLPYRKVDESEKIYFHGWNHHISDGKKARNFDKTEFYFGKKIADYCRQNNISSLWTDIIRDKKKVTNPWD